MYGFVFLLRNRASYVKNPICSKGKKFVLTFGSLQTLASRRSSAIPKVTPPSRGENKRDKGLSPQSRSELNLAGNK